MAIDRDSPHKDGSDPSRGELMNAEFLASWHGARHLQRQIAAGVTRVEAAASSTSVHDLWRHAHRQPGAPVSLAVERAIRSDAAAAARYRTILSGSALAYEPLARAASDGKMTSRRVGPYTFEIVGGGDESILLIRLEDGARSPGAIELRNGEASLRVALDEPVNSAIFLSLDPAHAEGRQLAALIGDPMTEIFVL
jgi:hypothetical protein